MVGLPSGERVHSYGKSPFLMGKSTINGSCSIAMLVYRRVVGFDGVHGAQNGWCNGPW